METELFTTSSEGTKDISQSEYVHTLPGHESELRNKLYQQWQESQHCDLIISLEGGELRAHSCILAAFSPKLKILLEDSNPKSKTVKKRCIRLTFQEKVFQCLLNMMYTGVLSFNTAMLSSVLSTARWMQMDEVVRLCQEYKDIVGIPIDESILTDEAVLIKVNAEDEEEEVGSHDKEHEMKSAKTSRKRGRKGGNPSKIVSPSSRGTQRKTRKGSIPDDLTIKEEPETEGDNIDSDVEVTDSDGAEDPSPDKIPKASKKTKLKKSKVAKSKRKPSKLQKTKASSIAEVKLENLLSDPSCKDPSLMSHIQWVEAQGLDKHGTEEADFAMGKMDHIKCKRCMMKFTELDKYFCHITDHPSYKCDQCDTTYYRQSNLTRHMRTNHSIQHHLRCQKCDFEAKTEKKLRIHFKEEHGSDKPFLCDFPGCTYSCWKFDFLRRHSEIHSDVKRYVCNKCGQGFAQHAGLMSHERTCYHLQQFLCDVCGQAFNHVQSMRSHRRSIHFGEKPYLCKVCGNQFSDQRNLKRHMRIHDNSFPYRCPVCQQNYRHSNSLKAHLKKHGEYNLNLNVGRMIKDSVQKKKRTPRSKQAGGALGENSVKCDGALPTQVRSEFEEGFLVGSGHSIGNVAEVVFPGQLIPVSTSQAPYGSSVAASEHTAASLSTVRPCLPDNMMMSQAKAFESSSGILRQLDSTGKAPSSDLYTTVPLIVSDPNLDFGHSGIMTPVFHPTPVNFSHSFLSASSLDSNLPRFEPLITSSARAASTLKQELLNAGRPETIPTVARMGQSGKIVAKDADREEAADAKLKGQSSYGLQTLAEICFSSSV